MRSNLNMPPFLPAWGGKRDYDMDAPITVFGAIQARTVGMWELFVLQFFFYLFFYINSSEKL